MEDMSTMGKRIKYYRKQQGLVFSSGEGLVMDCPEDTIKAVGYVGRAGMKQTDVEILNLMIGKTKIEDIEK